jgi:hypothetical protein
MTKISKTNGNLDLEEYIKDPCMCSCHIYGTKIMHCMACCFLCYKKYINVDPPVENWDKELFSKIDKKMKKVVDEKELRRLIEEREEWIKKDEI